ncbi:hypothetical protein C1645_145009 [Glomus cerebriforme]|uniref:Uncharacterized protein n=1 Tax=Glomus cerebriforme TaxID=658196 RepID=A0A397T6U7_9GLOM|nr:hypothetical protein C1645_145009 [Glomus cerebriforme]
MRQIENASRLKRIQNMKLSTEEPGSFTTVAQQISHKVKASVFHTIKTKNNSNFTKSGHEREIFLDRNSRTYNQKKLVGGQQHRIYKIQHNGHIPNGMNHFNDKNQKEPEQLYITITFPTRKCAMFYPIDGSLYYLQMQLKTRFEKKHKWRFLWYKSSNGYWDKLISEKDWQFAIHERLREKGFIRIEIYMKP